MKKKVNILIGENNSIVAQDILRVLSAHGYNVSSVSSSGEAIIRNSAALKPDLLLTEVHLDGKIDGIEAAHSVYVAHNIPVIFITSLSDRDTIEQVKKARPYGLLNKPLDEKGLIASIEMALYRHTNDDNKREVQEEPGRKNTSSGQENEEWRRATFIVRKSHLEKVKALAYWERKKLKDIINDILNSYLEDKEIKPIN